MNIKDKLDLINTPEDVFETGRDLLVDGHELVDTLSEYSPYLKLASKWMNKRRENKCKNFLQGLAMKIFSREDLTSDDLQKLDELLKKNVNRLLILDILEEATKTVSDTSSKLLGVIAGQVMEGHRTFDYNDWILINGLKNMNDWDIENLKKVYIHFNENPQDEYANTTCVYLKLTIKQYGAAEDSLKDNVLDDKEFKMFKSSLLRISNLQILSTGSPLLGKDSVAFVRSQVGDELYELIKLID
ncbi:hypothetical protein ACWFOP_20970 [Bacillus mycoides]